MTVETEDVPAIGPCGKSVRISSLAVGAVPAVQKNKPRPVRIEQEMIEPVFAVVCCLISVGCSDLGKGNNQPGFPRNQVKGIDAIVVRVVFRGPASGMPLYP